MRPDFCAASISSSASSIGAASPPAGIGSCCERMTASGASGAGLSSTATRASSSRKARGRGGRSLMRDGPRSGIAARGRAGSAARASPRAVSGGRKRTNRQSLSASGRAIASPSKIAFGSAGNSPGKTAASATPSKTWPPIVSPFSGTPMIASRVSRPMPDLSLARGADRGERDDVDLGPDPFRARDRPRRQGSQDRLQPVVARMMQMVGLGRREQDAVDAGAEDRGEARGASGAERAHDVGQRVLEIAERGRAGVERGEGVDQHDLPIEPGEMIAKERLDDMRLIGLVAARHHRGERALGRSCRRRRARQARRSAPASPRDRPA